MRLSPVAAVAVVCAASAACGIAIVGTGGAEPPPTDAGATDGVPVDGAQDDGGTSSDAADAHADTGADASCGPPPPTNPSAASHAFHAATPPVVDGDLAEWPCAAFVALDTASAGGKRGATPASLRFAAAWDSSGVFVAVRVLDAQLQGASSAPYDNDATELYLGGESTADGAFHPDDVQLIVDYQGLAKAYAPTNRNGSPPPAGVRTKTARTGDGYVVEIFVPRDVIGITTMTARSLLFDLQLDDNEGSPQTGVLWAYQRSAAGCGQCNCPSEYEPACDTFMWGTLSLEP